MFLVLSFVLLLACFDVDLCFAAPKVPKKTIPARDVAKLADLTGLSTSMLQQYDLDTATTLHVYAVAVCAVSDFDTVYQNSDKGTDFVKFYKRNYVTPEVQNMIYEKVNKLNEEFNKVSFKKDAYEGINKNSAAEVIATRFALSKSSVLEYGFGSGIPFNEILLCAAVAARTGNSLSVVIDKRKQGDSMNIVYLNYASLATQQAEINSLVAKYNEEIQIAAKAGVKVAKVEITKDLTSEAEKLAGFTGVSKDRIIEELKNGNSIGDIVKAIAVSKKLAIDMTGLLRIKKQRGWNKAYEYYLIVDPTIQAAISAIEGDINGKMNPPPPVR